MSAPRAVVFDLGGTLVHWPKWDEDAPAKWRLAYDALLRADGGRALPSTDAFVQAMHLAQEVAGQALPAFPHDGTTAARLHEVEGPRQRDRGVAARSHR